MNYRINQIQLSGVRHGVVCATVLQDTRFDRPGRIAVAIGDENVILDANTARRLAKFLTAMESNIEFFNGR